MPLHAPGPITTIAPERSGLKPTGSTRTLRSLHELIAALDRRVPRMERSGEASIAAAAAALRAEATARIAALEHETTV